MFFIYSASEVVRMSMLHCSNAHTNSYIPCHTIPCGPDGPDGPGSPGGPACPGGHLQSCDE